MLTGLGILNNGFYFLRWTGDDVSGSGSRDEYGIDDISVQATAPEMDVQGGSPLVSIANGDATPSTSDGTDFGSANIVTGMVDHTFTIENTGSADLNLTSGPPRVTVTGVDFSLITDASTPVSSGGGTTTFTVRFDPSATGLRSGSISIANNDADEKPYTFSIQGTGTATIDQVITNVLGDIATLLADPSVPEKAKNRLRDAQKALNKAQAKFANAKKQKDIKTAFANLQQGIEQLMKSGANVASLIDDLVNAAKQFAQGAINEAKNFAGDDDVDDEIEDAEEDFAHALQHVTNGEFDNAVKRFRKAWEHAQMALEAAGQPVLPKESEVEESEVAQAEVITDYVLEQNYPNPFGRLPFSPPERGFAGNPSTEIAFTLPEAGKVTLNIYALTGQLVATLVDGELPAGHHQLTWNGRNQSGQIAAGMYLYRLIVTDHDGNAVFTQTRRMTLLK
jgi:F0F1-type ATP synthase epsilon subunit